MKFNKALKVYAEIDSRQPCELPFYGNGSVSAEIRHVQYEVRSLKNRAMRMSYDYDQEQYEYFKHIQRCKEETGRDAFPTVEPRDFSKYKSFDGYMYDVLSDDYPTMAKHIAASVIRHAYGEYRNDKKAIVSGEKSLRTYGPDQPIPIRATSFKLTYENEFDFVIRVSVFSDEVRKSMGLKVCGVRFIVRENSDSERAILERLISGEYKLCETLLAYDSKKNHRTKMARGWYFCIGYSFEKDAENPELDKDKILGVDIGIANVLYLGWSEDEHFKKYIPGGEIRKFQATMERRKREMLQCGPARGDGSKGHGRKCATKRVDAFEHHIHNFKETKNWNYAHFVVDTAVANGFGTIQMEDLSGISKSEKFDRTWTFYSLQNKIEQLAKENGVDVRKIDPKYTSQMCSRCGYISHENRKSQSDFKCVACGYRRNADHNAAMNISKKDIEELIKAQLEKQGGV